MHAAFDEAIAEGRRTFAGANRFWAELVYAGTEFAWESANQLVQIDQDKYHHGDITALGIAPGEMSARVLTPRASRLSAESETSCNDSCGASPSR